MTTRAVNAQGTLFKRGAGDGVKATGTVTIVTAVAGNTVTLNGRTYTAISAAGTPVGNQWKVGAGGSADTDSATHLAALITTDTDNCLCTATSALGVVTITANDDGTGGNALTLAKVGSPLTVSGATLSGGTAEGYNTIAEVTSFTGPTETAKQIDVTSMDSTAREYIAGLRDAGEVSMEMNFVPESVQQQGLRSDIVNRVTRSFQMVLNDNTVDADKTTITFDAIITSFSIKGQTDSAIAASVSLKISGSPTIAYSDGT